MSSDVAIFDYGGFMITEGLNVARVKKLSGNMCEINTTDDNGEFSTWFCEFESGIPDVGTTIIIKKFKMTSVKNGQKYPVKTLITEWEYFKK